MDNFQPHCLYFEQAGAAIGGTLKPFAIMAGINLAKSTRDTVYVTPKTLLRIVDLVTYDNRLFREASLAKTGYDSQSFVVLLQGSGGEESVNKISNKNLRQIMKTLESEFKNNSVPIPSWILAISGEPT